MSATCSEICKEQLQQALDKSRLADVKFVLDGAWAVSGHRGVLSSRSAVFAKMFENETEEAETCIVKMDRVSTESLELFLEFLYLGNTFCPELRSVYVCAPHPLHV